MHAQALYIYDEDGRILGCNQFNGGDVPQFHLFRCESASFFAVRSDVADDVADEIGELVQNEPASFESPPKHLTKYLELLSTAHPVQSVWQGPVYRFETYSNSNAGDIVCIDDSKKSLLTRYMSDWIDDVGHRSPFMAVVENGHAIAVCASARITDKAHEAGVETTPDFRGKGYATRAVSAWAHAVRDLGSFPLYSTSWYNIASQAVARTLGLVEVGTDCHFT